MKKIYKEPLLHFLIIGALIFVLFSLVNKEEDIVSSNKIVVSTAEIKRLSGNWSRKWNRPPTETELKGLVDSYIKEEVYYREALALGLDQNDTVLRRRLMQKMEFLSNDLAELNIPDEASLNKYFLDNQDKYKLPARVSFTHIYFSLDKRGAKALEDAKSVLSELNALRAPEKGDSFMMQYDFVQETPFEVERLFGKGFAEQLFQSEINTWQGPIESGYGLHLVYISEKIGSRMPELASVIDEVRTDFMFEQRQKMNREIYEKFKERYEIVIEDMPKQSGIAKAEALDRKESLNIESGFKGSRGRGFE
jgi:parvulin-like peptidyl-prolyl isomerase